MRRGPLHLLTLVVALLAAFAGRATAATPDPFGPVLARIDSLYGRGRADVATATIESLITVARASGDRSLDAAMTARRSAVHMYFRRWPEALRDADHAIAIARSRRDSLTWARALLSKGRVLVFQERTREAAAVYRDMLRVSHRLDRPGLLGNARLGLAYLDLLGERRAKAEQGYREAVRLLSGGVDVGGELSARVGLARTLRARGKPREAQTLYREVIRRAIEVGDLRDQADAWNNMGAIEVQNGSRASATTYFQRAIECYRRLGAPTGTPVHNLALLLMEQHRHLEAKELIETELAKRPYPASSETGYRLRAQLGVTFGALRENAECERQLAALWALRDSMPQSAATDVASELYRLYESTGRPAQILTLIDEVFRQYGSTLAATARLSALRAGARAELIRGDAEAAFGWARRAARELPAQSADTRAAISVNLLLGECYERAGMRDSARAIALRIGRSVERLRFSTGGIDDELAVGANSSDIALFTARVMLDPARSAPTAQRAAEAFEALQRFKGRLYDRADQRLVRASDVQRLALREGDVFVDFYWSSRDSSLATLALTRSAAPRASFTPRLPIGAETRMRELYVTRPSADPAIRRAAARAVLVNLLGDTFDAVVSAKRVYCAPPSWLGSLPFAAMLDDVRPDPAREVVLVPSASWLVHARQHPARTATPAQLVRVGRSSDDKGRLLEGLRDEARWLEQRYGARGFLNPGDQPIENALAWLGRGDVLHVAAHSRLPNGNPWESALLLGRGDDEDAWLSMREISRRTSCAPLVVLATCNATAGSNLAHESVYGIASGFLAAGAHTVVSTLWDADDRTASRFTRLFYGALEKGRTAGQALGDARKAIAADPATSAPWYWAGFVLIGDPNLTVKLPRRGAGLLGNLPSSRAHVPPAASEREVGLPPLDNARVRP